MTILITGGNGFLGKRLGKILKERGKKVFLASRNNKQNLLAQQYSGCEAIAMDVSNIESVRDAFSYVKPDVVIHGAATKFVDLSEKYPFETLDINVLGSQNIARVAIEKNIKTVIGISTDKASPPIRNIYGLSKSMMERLFCSLNGRSGVKFLSVRYGNVAWSTGSVLGIWKKMKDTQGYFGTTGPEMYRYFFTVDEAVQLVLTAFDNAETLQGKVLSRMMKASKLEEILKVWSRMENIEYRKIDPRPGERLEEYLIGAEELGYAQETIFDNLQHYILNFNEKSPAPLREVLSSRTAVQLNESEIMALIKNPPYEEI
ncbi:SDR family NAD(P)-dependent oxidoreductase [Polynucleobacter sp. MWH-UH23A]|uniref:SDR family NAD(P)-dependent oxidoreductase n=1 Tax=Polynucleobacter sp. MWH-UH23A TaxID=1855613 RepID=UPI003364DB4D